MRQLYNTLNAAEQAEFVQERRQQRLALFKPRKRKDKIPSIRELAEILRISKDDLKKKLLLLPEFSVILNG